MNWLSNVQQQQQQQQWNKVWKYAPSLLNEGPDSAVVIQQQQWYVKLPSSLAAMDGVLCGTSACDQRGISRQIFTVRHDHHQLLVVVGCHITLFGGEVDGWWWRRYGQAPPPPPTIITYSRTDLIMIVWTRRVRSGQTTTCRFFGRNLWHQQVVLSLFLLWLGARLVDGIVNNFPRH